MVIKVTDFNIEISKSLWKKIVNYYRSSYTGVIPDSYKFETYAMHRIESAERQLNRLKSLTKRGGMYLDAGCGIGTFVLLANLAGYDFYGYDPGKEAVKIAKELLRQNGITTQRVQVSPEEKNISDKKFSLVTSFEVAEHLKNVDEYLKNINFLLKPKGRLFIETPNYLIPYEPHFYLFLPPGPRKLKWLFFRILGRNNYSFFNELFFVTKKSMELSLRKNNFRFKNVGQEEWLAQILGKSEKGRSKYFLLISRVVKQMKLQGAIRWLTKRGFYTPLVYIAIPRKTKLGLSPA